MKTYSEAFKAQMVQKLTAPGAPSATMLAREVGVAQPTLSRWVRAASRVGAMSKSTTLGEARRPQDWTAEEKLAAVAVASGLSEEELGGFLRRRGLHRSHLERWRGQMLGGLAPPSAKKSRKGSAEARRVRELERELRRKDKALAETAALLVLQKKARAIWGDGDEDTTPRSGK